MSLQRRRRFPAWLTILMVLLLATSCGGGESGGGHKPELVFRMALQPNPANKAWEAANLVRQELERRSNGRIKVMFYGSGVLGAERQILETCYLDVVEVVQCTSSVVTTLDPTFSLLDMPYLFVNEQHHLDVMNGGIGRELLDGLRRHGLQGLGFYSCGFRHMFNKQRPIRTPEDLQGLKIRVMESPVMILSLNAMGANATPLSAGELFQALKTGLVDGAENNPNTFVSEQFYDAGCKYFSYTGHFANQHVMIANLKWLERVRRRHPDLYELIVQVPRDILPEYNKRWDAAVEASVTQMPGNNVEQNDIESVQPFIDAVEPVYDEFFRRNPSVPRELVQRIRREAGL